MDLRILIPWGASLLPARAFLCLEERAESSGPQPITLGSLLPERHLAWSLREYLESKAQELRCLGVRASPLLVGGAAAESLLNCAQHNDIGLFVLSIEGPYRIEGRRLGKEQQLEPCLVPLTKFVCLTGLAHRLPSQPVLLDPAAPTTDLRSSLGDYLQERVQRLEGSGKLAEALVVHSIPARSLARLAHDAETGIFLSSIRGPYCIRPLSSKMQVPDTSWRGTGHTRGYLPQTGCWLPHGGSSQGSQAASDDPQ